MKILFLRHGETIDNLKGFDCPCNSESELTYLGRLQLANLIPKIQEYNPLKIYSSPKLRTQETVEVLNSKLNLQNILDERLKERNWGVWGEEQLTWREISQEKLKNLNITQRYELIPNNGESWKQMECRLLQCIDEIKQTESENIIVITHAGCLRALLPVLIDEDIKNHEKYSVSTSSLTVFCTEKNTFELFNYKSE